MTASAPHSPKHRDLRRINPQEAHDLMESDKTIEFIDIRSEIEHFFVGHPIGVYNIAWQEAPDWEVNPDFVTEIEEEIPSKETPVVLICRSGHRSIDAGNALLEAGYSAVYSVDEGFEGDRDGDHHRSSVNGWRFRALPWVQC